MSGRVWARKLLPAIKDHYTSDILKLFQSDFDEKKPTGWPAALLNNTRIDKSHHPLRHFLMMRFLGHSAESFFKSQDTEQPFGAGPWPCLNRICSQYKKLSITETKIVHRTVGAKGIRPVATFKCDNCGFTYYRSGPDRRPEDLFRVGRVLKYGPIWEEALRQFWNDPSQDIAKARTRLRIGRNKLIDEAERLGLIFPRRGPGNSVVEKGNKQERGRRKKKPSKEEINKYRREWQRALKNNPGISLRALRKKHEYHLYNWLKWNDAEWLAEHRPQPRKVCGSRFTVDWRIRDAHLARAVSVTAKLLEKLPGKPMKITKALLAKNIDGGSKLHNQLHKLPRTRKAIEKVVENRSEFAERRLWWTVKSCREEKVTPAGSELRRRASLSLRDLKALPLKEGDKP